MKQKTKFFIVLIVFVFSLACGVVVNNEKFDSLKWKNGDGRTRGRMIYDLQDNKALIGKTKQEVADMLYEPERMKELDKDLTKDTWVFAVDTNTFWDLLFTVIFDKETQRVISTDIHD